jgi:hypothetical protein
MAEEGYPVSQKTIDQFLKPVEEVSNAMSKM